MKHHADESIALKKVIVKTDKAMTKTEKQKAEATAVKRASNDVRSRFGLLPLKK